MRKALVLVILVGTVLGLLVACGPAATPTPTPTKAAVTPTPTAAPAATATPTTPPQPTATATLKPGETPKPTNTPTATSTKAPPTATSIPTATPTPTTAPFPTQVFAPKGNLIEAIQTLGLQMFDPVREDRASMCHYQAPIFDTLLGSDPKSGAIIDGIAETWEQSKDGLSWTFHIRKGLTWQNGDPITAEDVMFTYQQYLAPDAINGGTWPLEAVSGEVIDQYTFKVTTKAIDVYFGSKMSRAVGEDGVIIPKKYAESIGMKEFAKKPVGSGPWKFKDSATGVKVLYEAWDKHYRYKPNYQTLTIVMVPEESTRVAMLRTGQAAIAAIEPDSMAELSKAGVQMVMVPAVEQSAYYIWGTYDPRYAGDAITSVKVREALSLALNRQEIIDYVMEGKAAMPLPFGAFRYSVDIDVARWEQWSKEKLRYDPEAAKKLIADAGFAGFKLRFMNYDRPGSAYQKRVGEAQAAYWEKIGIDVDMQMSEWGVFSPMRREYDPVSGSQKVLAGQLTQFRAVGRPTTLDRSYSGLRWDGDERVAGSPLMKTPEALKITDLYSAAYGATDPQDRFKKTNDALQYMADLWLVVPVIEAGAYWAVNPELVGKFSGTPGRGELGEVMGRVPRPDQSPWK